MGRKNDAGNPNAPFVGRQKKSKAPYIVGQIVGRCHVGQSDRQVIRYFISRLKRKYRTWAALPRAERKQWLRWIIATHQDNRNLYTYVMRGR